MITYKVQRNTLPWIPLQEGGRCVQGLERLRRENRNSGGKTETKPLPLPKLIGHMNTCCDFTTSLGPNVIIHILTEGSCTYNTGQYKMVLHFTSFVMSVSFHMSLPGTSVWLLRTQLQFFPLMLFPLTCQADGMLMASSKATKVPWRQVPEDSGTPHHDKNSSFIPRYCELRPAKSHLLEQSWRLTGSLAQVHCNTNLGPVWCLSCLQSQIW